MNKLHHDLYLKKIENAQKTGNCADVFEYLDNLLMSSKITDEEYDILTIKAKHEVVKTYELSSKEIADFVDKQIKICRQLGCRLIDKATILYNPYNEIKIEISHLYKLKTKRQVTSALFAIKTE